MNQMKGDHSQGVGVVNMASTTLAPKQKKTKIRGQRKMHKHIADDTNSKDENEAAIEDIMTPEDKLLLKDVNDEEEISDVEIDVSGNDVSESEILSFLQKLGVEKHRPFPASKPTEKQQSKDVKNITNTDTKIDAAKSGHEKVNKNIKQGSLNLTADVVKSNKNEVSKAKSVVNPVEVQSVVKFLQLHKTRKHLLLKPGDMWREEQVHQMPGTPPDEKLVHEAENLAQRLLEDEVALYSKQREQSKRSEARWLKTVLSSGTLSDKMAALTLLIQESPMHNLASVDSLISMSKKKGRREAMMAVDTLKDLFLTGLLPDERKLRAFNQQPILELLEVTSGNVDARDKLLVMWHFEALLKKRYTDFTKALGDMSFDTLQATKEKALSSIHQLLTGKPEQENTLLPMLVNKLGDPAVKSKATYLLTKLVDEHPNMKHVIVREVQQLLHRPNISQRAQYHAICFLTQLRLSHAHGDLASQLLQIYFYFFQTYLTKGDIDNKMMSALLTGVNRAYVYAKGNKEVIAEQMDAIYKIIPSTSFHTGVQALTLLYQVMDASTNASDRYYMCLYRKLMDPALKNSSKQAIFMNLLFKSIKTDAVDKRIRAFLKRSLQVYSQQPPQIICGVLIHLSQLLKEKPGLLDVKHMATETWSDDEEERFVDLPAPAEFDTPETSKDFNENAIEEETQEDQKTTGTDATPNKVKGSWVHRANFGGKGQSCDYDPYNRNPLYSRAELDCIWELEQLVTHYHPTVRLYAASVLQGKSIKYDGDALQDYTLIRFLDRFVYKNPKKESTNTQISHFKKADPSGIRAVPVNSKEFLEIGEEDVPEDEKFFHRYFSERASRQKELGSDGDSDSGSIGDDEFDAFLDGFEKDVDKDDLGDLDLDFAGDSYRSKPKDKKKKQEKISDDESLESDDFDDEDDLGDEELAAEFQQEMEGLDVDSDVDSNVGNDLSDADEQLGSEFADNDLDFDEDDELKMMMQKGKSKKRKQQKDGSDDFGTLEKKQKNSKFDTADLFASAEQFAHLLEEDAESGQISLGGMGDLRNKDKAAQKQLKWEADRDRWVAGKKNRHNSHKKDFKTGNKKFQNKRKK
ncbi:hypothetical protein BsWGS_14605 [Bradybaena similaris]